MIYRGLDNFIVKASTAAEAKELARVKFNAGQAPDTLGNEWEAIEEIEEPQPLPDEENT